MSQDALVRNEFSSELFAPNLHQLDLPDSVETVFATAQVTPEQIGIALAGMSRFAILGYSSQGPAHAQNIRDSFAKMGLDNEKEVVIGLRIPSSDESEARYHAALDAGFTVVSPEQAAEEADFLAMLIGDSGQVADAQRYIDSMRPGATLGFAHGFYLRYREQAGLGPLRPDIDIDANCPKGMGATVRDMYKRGSGINASFAVEQDFSGGALDKALAWVALNGSPFGFQTTLRDEALSDLVGERAILLGEADALVKSSYHSKLSSAAFAVISEAEGPKRVAYQQSVESLVGPIADTIKYDGLVGVVDRIKEKDMDEFVAIYNAAYPWLREVTAEIYDEVESGREIASVVSDGQNDVPMANIAEEEMWVDNEEVRKSMRESGEVYEDVDTLTAALYIAGLMAQVDVLREKGHNWTEVVNESIIEGFASLLPFMKKGGLVEMVDGCSITARRGDRRWRGRFNEVIDDHVLPQLDKTEQATRENDYFAEFHDHPVHAALATLSEYQPRDKEGNIISLVS